MNVNEDAVVVIAVDVAAADGGVGVGLPFELIACYLCLLYSYCVM